MALPNLGLLSLHDSDALFIGMDPQPMDQERPALKRAAGRTEEEEERQRAKQARAVEKQRRREDADEQILLRKTRRRANLSEEQRDRFKMERPLGVTLSVWEDHNLFEQSEEKEYPPVLDAAKYTEWEPGDLELYTRRVAGHIAREGRLVPHIFQPKFEEVLPEVWVLCVKQPFATLLVQGVKDVENRSTHFDGERWAIVKASKTPAKGYQADVETRLKHSGQDAVLNTRQLGEVLGLVKFRCYSPREWVEGRMASVWYNGGADFAYHVVEAFEFIPGLEHSLEVPTRLETMARLANVGDSSVRVRITDILREQLSRMDTEGASSSGSGTHTRMDTGGGGPLQAPPAPPAPPAPQAPQAPPAAQPPADTGGGGASRHIYRAVPAGTESPSVALFDGTVQPTSLNELGCKVWPLAALKSDVSIFIEQLRSGAAAWFRQKLSTALRTSPPPPGRPRHNAQAWKTWEDWNALGHEVKEAVIGHLCDNLNLTTNEGLERFFVAGERKKAINSFQPELPEHIQEYLQKRITCAKQGLQEVAQNNPQYGWTQRGFGFWTAIWSKTSLDVILEAQTVLKLDGFDTDVAGIPHIIAKPPNGDPLPGHHDQIPTRQLYLELQGFQGRTNREWADEKGVQGLAHLQGGRQDGYTCTVSPMNCDIYLTCLELLIRLPPSKVATLTAETWDQADITYEQAEGIVVDAWNYPKAKGWSSTEQEEYEKGLGITKKQETDRLVFNQPQSPSKDKKIAKLAVDLARLYTAIPRARTWNDKEQKKYLEAQSSFNTFNTATSGPYFVNWEKLVEDKGTERSALNQYLMSKHVAALHVQPIAPPLDACPIGTPYFAMWLLGFPHFSAKNRDPRWTLTMPLQSRKLHAKMNPSHITRLLHLGSMSHPTGQEEEEAAKLFFETNTEQLAEGPTHRDPRRTVALQARGGPFAEVAPTRAQAIVWLTKLGFLIPE